MNVYSICHHVCSVSPEFPCPLFPCACPTKHLPPTLLISYALSRSSGGGGGDSGCSCEGCDYNVKSKLGRCTCGEKHCSFPDKCECVCHGFKSSDSKLTSIDGVFSWWDGNTSARMTIIIDIDSVTIFSPPAGMVKLEGARHLTDKEVEKVDKMIRFEAILRFLMLTKRWSVVVMDMDKNILSCNKIDGMVPFTVKRYKDYFDYAAKEYARHKAEDEAKAAKAAAAADQAAADDAEQQRQFKEARELREAREAEDAAKVAAGESQQHCPFLPSAFLPPHTPSHASRSCRLCRLARG